VQIKFAFIFNQFSQFLIKFIAGGKKWILYENLKKNCGLTLVNHRHQPQN